MTMTAGDCQQTVAPGAVASVVGCGAMGRGIAQLLAQAGLEVRLHDARAGAADAARGAIAGDLDKLVARGKLAPADARATAARLQPVVTLSRLDGATLIVEAVVEDLDTKRRLFSELESIVEEGAILATNTSSLSVTAIASACRRPERVAGFHFFNPAPVMKVVEVIAAVRTDAAVCDALASLAERFGHTPVRATDSPGFIVNHAGRGYVTEGLRILAEGICEPAVLDAVLRDACGFKLGPCELLDLTGVDVSHPVMESIYHQFYEEPRYRPQVLTRRMLDAGLLGRKASAGFYRYVDGQQMRPAATDGPSRSARPVWIDPTVPELAARAATALAPGVAIDNSPRPTAESLIIVTPVGGDTTRTAVASGLDPSRTIGFDALFPGRGIRCLFANPSLADDWRNRAAAAFASAGTSVHLVRDSLGLICQRVIAHIVNIGCSIAEQRIASPSDIDRAVKLGLGYPNGPLAWGDEVGAATVGRILDELLTKSGDPRYRSTSWLARRAALQISLTKAD